MHKLDQTTTSHSLDTNSPALLKAGDDTAQTSDPTLGVGCEGDSSAYSKDAMFDEAKLEHLCANKANHAFTIALPILTSLLKAKNLDKSKDTLSESLVVNDSREEICIATILAALNKAQDNFADKFLELSSSIQELIYPKLNPSKQQQVLSLAYNNDFLLSLQLSHGLLEPLLAKKLCFISINGDKEHTQALIAIPRQIASTNQELENQDLSKPKALLIEQRADGNECNEFANEYWELYYFENFCSEDLITLDSSYLLVGDNLVSHGALFKHHQILDLSQLELILEPKFLVDNRFYGPFAASLQSLANKISTYVPKEWSQVATCLTSAPQFSSSYVNSLAQNTDSLPIRLAVALLYICVVNDEAYSPNIDDEQLKSFHQLAFNSIKAQLPDALKAILQDYSSLSKRLAVNASVINKLWASNEEITNKYYPAIEHLVAKLGIGDSNENNSSLEKLIALLQPRIERSLIIMDDDLVIPLCRYFELTHIQYPQSNDLSSFIAPTIDVKKIVQKTSGNDLLDYLLASYAFVYKTSLLWVFDSELGSLLHNDCVQSLFFAPEAKLKNFASFASSKKLIAFDSTTRTASNEYALPDNSSNTEAHAQEAPEDTVTGVSDDTWAVVSVPNSIIVGSFNSIDRCAQILLNLPNNPLFALTDELILVGYSASMLKYCYQLKSLGNALKFSNTLKHFRKDHSELAQLSQYQYFFSVKQSNEFLDYCKSQDLQLNYPANNNTKLIYHRLSLESFDFSYIKPNDNLQKIVQGYEYITEVAELVSPLNFSLNFVRSTYEHYGNWELSSFIKEDVYERYYYGYDNLAYYYASQLKLLKELLAQNFIAQAYTQVLYIVPLEQDVDRVSAIIKELKDFNENKIAISVLSLRTLVSNKNYTSLWSAQNDNTNNLIVVDNLLSNYATELLSIFKDPLVALKSNLESQVAQENQFLAVSELSSLLDLSCLPLTVTTNNNSTSACSDSTFMLNLYQMGRNFLSIKFLQYKDSYLGFDVKEFYRDPSAILTCMITGLMCLLQKYFNSIKPSSTVALYCLDPKFTFDLENQTNNSPINYSKTIFKDLGLVSHFKYIDLPLFNSDDELNSYRSLVGKFFNKDEYSLILNKGTLEELEIDLIKETEEPTKEPEVEVEVEVVPEVPTESTTTDQIKHDDNSIDDNSITSSITSADQARKERNEEPKNHHKTGIGSILDKIFGINDGINESNGSSKEKQDDTTTVTTKAIETTKVRLPEGTKDKTTLEEPHEKPGSVDSNIFVNSPELVLKYLSFDKDSPEYQQALEFALGEMSKSLIDGNEWRDYQKAALPHILSHDKDCIISIPTGGGKSVLFQGPALFRAIYSKKLSIVISPLKALIIDQVMTLKAKGFKNVDYLSSDRLFQENSACIEKIKSGQINLVYVTPERFRTRSFYILLNERLKRDHGAEYFIFDEAHCISQWGKTFRPDYIFAAECCSSLKEQYGGSFIMCSATMTQQVIKDIEQYLDNHVFLDNKANKYNPIPEHIVMSVRDIGHDPQVDKIDAILAFIESNKIDFNKSRMIIFCQSRSICEELSDDLNTIANKRKQSNPQSPIAAIAGHVSYFHAGLSAEQRKYRFECFKNSSNLPNDPAQTVVLEADQTTCDYEQYTLSRDLKALKDTAELSLEEEEEEDSDTVHSDNTSGNKRDIFILCSTKAFGMGMDIPNIHYVLHHTLSNLFEDYLQEVGRAGRSYQSYQDTFTNNRKLPALCLYEKQDLDDHVAKMNNNMISWGDLVSAERLIRSYIAEFESLDDAKQIPCIVPISVIDRSENSILEPNIHSISDSVYARIVFYYLEYFTRIKMLFRGQVPLLFSVNKEQLEQFLTNNICKPSLSEFNADDGQSDLVHFLKEEKLSRQKQSCIQGAISLAQFFINGLNYFENQLDVTPNSNILNHDSDVDNVFDGTEACSDANADTEQLKDVSSSPNNALSKTNSRKILESILTKVKSEMHQNRFTFDVKNYCKFTKLNNNAVYNSLIELNRCQALRLETPLLINILDKSVNETNWFYSKYLEKHKKIAITDHQITLMLPTLGVTLAVVRELLDEAYQHYVYNKESDDDDAYADLGEKSDDLELDQAYLEKERIKAHNRSDLKKRLDQSHYAFKGGKIELGNPCEYYFTSNHLLSLVKDNLGNIEHLCHKFKINNDMVLYMPWETNGDRPLNQNKSTTYLDRLIIKCIRTFFVICSYLPNFELRAGSDKSVNIESASDFILYAPNQSYHLMLDVLAQDAVELVFMLSGQKNLTLAPLLAGLEQVNKSSSLHVYNWMDLIDEYGLVHDDPKALLDKYDLSCSRSDFDQLYPLCQSKFDGFGYFSFLLDVLSNLKLTYNSNIINFGYEVTLHEDAIEPLDAAIKEDSPFYPLRKELEMVDKTNHARALIMKVFLTCLEDSERAEFIERFFKIEDYRGYVDLLTLYSQGIDDSILSELTSEALNVQEAKFKDNDEQKAIYEEPLSEHHINVISGPGSGKTFILTMKVARLVIREHVSPRNILVLAYNRAVVTELKSRLNKLFTELGLGGLAHRLNIFTFHGLAKYCLKNALNDIDPKEWEYKLLENLQTNHQEYLKIFKNLEYILIDEFQDITFTRLNFLLLLRQLTPRVHFFTIGDMNQSIYGFDRVNNEIGEDFVAFAQSLVDPNYKVDVTSNVTPKERNYALLLHPYPYYEYLNKLLQPKTLHLSQNYRSYQGILDKSAQFIDNTRLLPVSNAALQQYAVENCALEFKAELLYSHMPHFFEKARESLAAENSEKTSNPFETQDEKALHNVVNTIAFLYRTNNDVYKGFSALNRNLLEDFDIYIQGSSSCESFRKRELFALQQFIEKQPKRITIDPQAKNYFGNKVKQFCLSKIEQFKNWDSQLLDIGYCLVLNFIAERRSQSTSASVAIEELKDYYYDILRSDDNLQLMKIYDAYKDDHLIPSKPLKLILSTMHKVKGLEFDMVIVMPSNSSLPLIPHNTGSIALDQANNYADLQEEKRLYYVAYTRAKKYLLSYIGPREEALRNNRLNIVSETQEQGFVNNDARLDHYYISFNALASNFFNNDYIENQVAINDPVNIYYDPRSRKYLILHGSSNNVVGCLSSKNPIARSMARRNVNFLTGFFVSSVVAWTYQDTCQSDENSNIDNPYGKKSEFAKSWSQAAIDKGYIYIVMIAGYGYLYRPQLQPQQ